MNDKLLSVIVPSYNMEAYLSKNIESMLVADEVLRQRLEIIVVNDGSKDRTSEIAHSYANEYPGVVTVIDKPNGHYGSCINAALPVAKGEYIRVLDADDYVNREEFERFLAYLNKYHSERLDLIISDVCYVNPDGSARRQVRYDLPTESAFTLDGIGLFNKFVGLHAITYRTQMLRDMNYRQTEGCAYTDTEWNFLPMTRVRDVRYFNGMVTCYLLGRDGQTMQMDIFERDYGVVLKIWEKIIGQWNSLAEKSALEGRSYTYDILYGGIWSVYRFVLYRKRLDGLNEALKSFDIRLKETLPELYQELVMPKHPLRKENPWAVNVWRKHYTAYTWRFAIYYGRKNVGRFLRNLRKKSKRTKCGK